LRVTTVKTTPLSRRRIWGDFWRQGLPAIWTSGAMLLCIVAMLTTILVLTLVRGLGQFWAKPLVRLETTNGVYMGTVQGSEAAGGGAPGERTQLRIGNRDLYGLDFRWFEPSDIKGRTTPTDAVVVERDEHGNFHGFLRELHLGERNLVGDAAWQVFAAEAETARRVHERLMELDARDEAGQDVSIRDERQRLSQDLQGREAVFEDAGGTRKNIRLEHVVRAYRPNDMGPMAKSRLYVARFWEFVATNPRESNTEGGIFPALFGTVLMVVLMTLAVVPLGVIAALYLHEYAREGPLLRAVRSAVGNLAGVPSIVFGMFGLAFFVYGVGGNIDRMFFSEALPTPTFGTGGILWASMTLALLTLPVVVVATEEGLSAVPRASREGSLALGATQWQTLRHVVLPQAVPGILTGVILATSRAAGEVAPLMLTGVVKLAPSLALDGSAPFVHLERKFMHLGFHIYDVSMQSPNVEAAKPMVYSTTLLLLILVVALNATAITVRNRMRRRYRGAAL